MELDADTRRSRATGFGFSLLALLALVSVVCGVFGYWRLSRGHRVTAYLEVRFSASSPESFAQNRQGQIDLLGSHEVLSKALEAPGIRSLRTVAAESDRESWLSQRLQVAFSSDSSIMEVRLEGRRVAGLSASDDAKLVEAVLDAYRAVLSEPPAWFTKRKLSEAAVHVIQRPVITER